MLLQQAMVTQDTNKHKVHVFVDALCAFFELRQSSNMSHSVYLDRFTDLVEVKCNLLLTETINNLSEVASSMSGDQTQTT